MKFDSLKPKEILYSDEKQIVGFEEVNLSTPKKLDKLCLNVLKSSIFPAKKIAPFIFLG